jgi:hypothetical protein
MTDERNIEAAKQHSSRGHFVDQRVQPIDEQQFVVRRLTSNRDRRIGANDRRIHNDCGERQCDPLESLLREWPQPRTPISAPCLKCSQPITYPSNVGPLIAIAERLRDDLRTIRFGAAVRHVYNPLVYAWTPHGEYLRRFGPGAHEVLIVGMNAAISGWLKPASRSAMS